MLPRLNREKWLSGTAVQRIIQELRSRANTVQLLATTDSNLKKISDRQLSAAQQSTLDQIRTYVRQSRAASDAGDLPRAHTLANKAHLLSDELAGK